jgi:hypothetical protein
VSCRVVAPTIFKGGGVVTHRKKTLSEKKTKNKKTSSRSYNECSSPRSKPVKGKGLEKLNKEQLASEAMRLGSPMSKTALKAMPRRDLCDTVQKLMKNGPPASASAAAKGKGRAVTSATSDKNKKFYDAVYMQIGDYFTQHYDVAFGETAGALGKDDLTDAEKRKALAIVAHAAETNLDGFFGGDFMRRLDGEAAGWAKHFWDEQLDASVADAEYEASTFGAGFTGSFPRDLMLKTVLKDYVAEMGFKGREAADFKRAVQAQMELPKMILSL